MGVQTRKIWFCTRSTLSSLGHQSACRVVSSFSSYRSQTSRRAASCLLERRLGIVTRVWSIAPCPALRTTPRRMCLARQFRARGPMNSFAAALLKRAAIPSPSLQLRGNNAHTASAASNHPNQRIVHCKQSLGVLPRPPTGRDSASHTEQHTRKVVMEVISGTAAIATWVCPTGITVFCVRGSSCVCSRASARLTLAFSNSRLLACSPSLSCCNHSCEAD